MICEVTYSLVGQSAAASQKGRKMAASGVVVAASVAKAASVPVAAASAQPVVVVVQSMPSTGILPWIQTIGTIVVALIAATIAGTIQWRQMQIAKGALRTADNKLRLDLYERRFVIVTAALDLIADRYIDSKDDSVDGDYKRMHEALVKIGFASWLFDMKVDLFISMMAAEANERFRSLDERLERERQAYKEKGYHLTDEVIANRARVEQQSRQLVKLVEPYMAINH